MKLPQAIMSLAISADGMHYVVGLIDGSLVIKSK